MTGYLFGRGARAGLLAVALCCAGWVNAGHLHIHADEHPSENSLSCYLAHGLDGGGLAVASGGDDAPPVMDAPAAAAPERRVDDRRRHRRQIRAPPVI